jgi:hypothetical protein
LEILKMNRSDYPEIEVYRYHFMAILASETNAELTAVGESIAKTVSATHKELPLLVEAGQQRRQELADKVQESKSE